MRSLVPLVLLFLTSAGCLSSSDPAPGTDGGGNATDADDEPHRALGPPLPPEDHTWWEGEGGLNGAAGDARNGTPPGAPRSNEEGSHRAGGQDEGADGSSSGGGGGASETDPGQGAEEEGEGDGPLGFPVLPNGGNEGSGTGPSDTGEGSLPTLPGL